MYANPALENVFGTIGTVLWCIQIIPQIVINYRRKDTKGLSSILMFTWSAASIFLGIYCIVQNINIPIIVQPQLFGFLAAVCWIQCLYYGPRKLSLKKSIILLTVYLLIFGGLQAGLVFATRAGIRNGTDAPLTLFGVISVIGLLGGLIPQYYEIFKYKEVIGLSLIFMTVRSFFQHLVFDVSNGISNLASYAPQFIYGRNVYQLDMLGGLFCTLSLVFKEKFDILASVNYIGIFVLDLTILILAAILNPRANRRRRAQGFLEPCSTSPDSSSVPVERSGLEHSQNTSLA
ncbi:Predicted membrane protein [Phaffia rhodozyma]|uniref:Predicted membrane protein n=1 Tax=Phaffia rhodozyma TaxID=264483 RepID=A0A0F7STY6_PHARH|nr:Predicted membrane protein [Phaffia rhodozyma]